MNAATAVTRAPRTDSPTLPRARETPIDEPYPTNLTLLLVTLLTLPLTIAVVIYLAAQMPT